MGINCHWRKDNITSLIRPCIYNKGKVAWMGVRYGKTKAEVMALNYNETDDVLGFQKHGCLQYCLIPEGFVINLFLSVKNDAVDRAYLFDNIDKLSNNIEIEIEKLNKYNFLWNITDEKEKFTLDIKDCRGNQFIQFLKKYDKPGRESYLEIFYPPDDPCLSNEDILCNEILRCIKLLLPIYNNLVYRPKV